MPSMPQESNAMAGMTPAFMNQPQYQQQMQSLAMQVRQQEEGTKKIKKFLKAYEDIQLSAPMMQAPQQPRFMGGNQMSNQEQGFFQPPGGAVRSMSNNLPRNDMTEPAPTSFTEMAGGSVPPEPTYEEAPIGEEEAMGGVPRQDQIRLNQGSYPDDIADAPNDSETRRAEKRRLQREYDAKPLEQRGVRRGGSPEEWQQGLRIDDSVPPPTGRDTSEDKYPLEHRGDWDAKRVDRQQQRVRDAQRAKEIKSGYGEARVKLIKAYAAKEHHIDEFNRVAGTPEYEKNYKIYDQRYNAARDHLAEVEGLAKEFGIDVDDPDFQKSVQAEKTRMNRRANATPGRDLENDPTVRKSEEPKEIKTSKGNNKEIKKEPQGLNKGLKNLAGIRRTARGIMDTGMKAAVFGASAVGAAAGAMFPPEDAEIMLGRINSDRDFNKLNDREKAAVQKFLEYKAESDSLPARSGVRRNASDEPIEYSSAEKALFSQ